MSEKTEERILLEVVVTEKGAAVKTNLAGSSETLRTVGTLMSIVNNLIDENNKRQIPITKDQT